MGHGRFAQTQTHKYADNTRPEDPWRFPMRWPLSPWSLCVCLSVLPRAASLVCALALTVAPNQLLMRIIWQQSFPVQYYLEANIAGIHVAMGF